MSDIEDDLFNNSDDNDSDDESVAESEPEYDVMAGTQASVVNQAKKQIIGAAAAGAGADDDDEEYEIDDDDEDMDEDADDADDGSDVEDEGRAPPNNNTKLNADTSAVLPNYGEGGLSVNNMGDDTEDEGEDSDEDENYLQKFDAEIKKNYIMDYHPECMVHNYEEISALSKVVRDKDNIIIDPLHRTIPYLTKYERARVLGQRAKQINLGARPFVKVPENIIDGHLVAEMELMQKRIPFIIRRPLPGNSGSEYWNLKDLEIISF